MGLRVETEITGAPGGPYYNRLNFTGTTQTDAQNAADAVQAFWDDIAAGMHESATVRVQSEVIAYSDTTGEPDAVFTVTGLEPLEGAGESDPLPWATQGLVRLRTGVFDQGREIRGRIFLPAMLEPSSTDGRPTSALITLYNTAINTLIDDEDSQLAVYSRKAGATAVVTSGSLWDQWATLRSRRD